ncbi:hypothetical protein Nepgr_019350 [Nepenthes gracilis]|uniref:Uncharacterized protein n=1 Tax=Nepenthes gracilis TaxID=150966 RepID=A0AAD3SVN7_NEPGR|nr:hypothetical protein Nepgr_019350 [Nepenthes gracilis]
MRGRPQKVRENGRNGNWEVQRGSCDVPNSEIVSRFSNDSLVLSWTREPIFLLRFQAVGLFVYEGSWICFVY